MKRTHWLAALRRMDWAFLFALGMLLLLGILFIYSASARNAEEALSEMSRPPGDVGGGRRRLFCGRGGGRLSEAG
jgi:cbb3-type cytochrome oxidase subunit 3